MTMVTTSEGGINLLLYTGQADDEFTVDWGDLSTPDVWTTVEDEENPGNYFCAPYHEYSGAGSKTISITGDLGEVVSFVCQGNELTSIDVSSLTALQFFGCSDNNLTTIDVSSNTDLFLLYCDRNNLTSLDLSSNAALMEVNCSGNGLSATVVDEILADLDANEAEGGNIKISNNSPPTAAGLASKVSLEGKEWLVVVSATFYPEEYQTGFGVLLGSEGQNVGLGQSFCSGGGVLDSAKFYCAKTGSPTGNAYAKIYAHGSEDIYGEESTPVGSPLAVSDARDVSEFLSYPSIQLETFNFSGANRITLTAATPYVVTIEYSEENLANYVVVGYDDGTLEHDGNYSSLLYEADWESDEDIDLIFYVYVSADVYQPRHGFINFQNPGIF